MAKLFIGIFITSWVLIIALAIIEEFVYTKLKSSSKFKKWWRSYVIGHQED